MSFQRLLEIHIHPDSLDVAEKLAHYLRAIQKGSVNIKTVQDQQVQPGKFEVYDPISCAGAVDSIVRDAEHLYEDTRDQ